jgi:hypothetical protein
MPDGGPAVSTCGPEETVSGPLADVDDAGACVGAVVDACAPDAGGGAVSVRWADEAGAASGATVRAVVDGVAVALVRVRDAAGAVALPAGALGAGRGVPMVAATTARAATTGSPTISPQRIGAPSPITLADIL